MLQSSRRRTLPDLPLARGTLDRDAEARADPKLLTRLLTDARTRVLYLHDGRAALDAHGALVLRAPGPADATRPTVYLGRDGDQAAYLAVVGEAMEEGVATAGLRDVGALLSERDAGLFTTALALANWHAAHPHCSRCGARTVPVHGGWVRRCEAEGSEHYPRTDPAVIVAVVDEQDRILLARGPAWPARSYSVLAGFVEPGESLETTVVREVREEVGVDVTDVEYLGNQPWPFPCSLMLGFRARATSTALTLADGEIEHARWLSRPELADLVAAGELKVSGRLSIARALVEHWYGARLASPVEQATARG